MITQAYFDNIQSEIIKEIKGAQRSIYVAVAWLTDKMIFHELCLKAKAGLIVELIVVNDEINKLSTNLNHSQLSEYGGKVYFINPSQGGAIMHHKFCILDEKTVITGSYNWSKRAQNNDENIVITSEANELGWKFIQEFNTIRERMIKATYTIGQIDLVKVLKRLDIIKSLILLEESDDVQTHVIKLKQDHLSAEIIDIINKLENKDFSSAIALIEDFRAQQSKLTIFEDPELFALQLELNSLAIQFNAIDNEKVELEKTVYEFSIKYNQVLGKTILEILKLKKQLASGNEEKEQAEKDESDYKEDYESKKDLTINILTEAEIKEIKKCYREASLQCHPDKFINDPIKMQLAQKVFVTLTEAYKSNDLARVKSILGDLKLGIIKIEEIQSNKKEIIRIQISNMKLNIKNALDDLVELKTSPIYKVIEKNSDLTVYLADMKNKLEFELELLRTDLKNTHNEQ